MATIEKIKLSHSTDGRPIEVAATSSAGTDIHTGSGTATTYDEVWIWASSASSQTETLVLEWGGTTNADDRIYTTLNPNETVLVAPGWLIKGNASTALIVKAYTTTTEKVNIVGYVNRITA